MKKDLKDGLQVDEALKKILSNFRSSARAWGENAYSRPHEPVKVYATSWRAVAGWTLGCLVAIASVSGGLFEHHRTKEQARIAAAAETARQQKIEAERRIESEELAKIDGDVSREVPSAMEPLAQMMVQDSSE